MRLWHQSLIPYLPRQQLLGQHRECCALRGMGWGKPHSVVNYVFEYSPTYLAFYHRHIMLEMQNRGYSCEEKWFDIYYRGKNMDRYKELKVNETLENIVLMQNGSKIIYPEHNNEYLKECLINLYNKFILDKIKKSEWEILYNKFGGLL